MNPYFLVATILMTLVISGSGYPVSDESIIWWPNELGTGLVPAYLNSSGMSKVTPFSKSEDIHFYLYTKYNTLEYDELFETTESVLASHWDVNAPVKFFVHGFSSSFDSGSGEAMKQGYIIKEYPVNVNLVLVQWRKLAAAPFYDVAAKNTKLVGERVAQLVTFLVENEFTTLSAVHLAGHSLGAHAMGYAGRFYKELNPGKIIPRITGHDPALPLFGNRDDSDRIDPTDAEMVDIIHTASGSIWEGELSFMEPRGTIDFYPNGGRDQPGCTIDPFGSCSHGRCYEFFAESIHNDVFTACKCADDAWDPAVGKKFESCSCVTNGAANMGEWTSPNARGIYYLTTNPISPYAKG